MMNLLGEKQTCPALAHLVAVAFSTARSRSASDKTTNGSLPPSSITDLFKYLPAISEMYAPALDDPVKLTPTILGFFITCSSWSRPVSTLWYQPESKPAYLTSCSTFWLRMGVESAPRTSSVFPSSKLGSPPLKDRKNGKLKGMMQQTTPMGKYLMRVLTLASDLTWVGSISPKFLEQYLQKPMVLLTSPVDCLMGLPIYSVIISASVFLFFSNTLPRLPIMSALSCGLRWLFTRQPSWLLLILASSSAEEMKSNSALILPVKGFFEIILRMRIRIFIQMHLYELMKQSQLADKAVVVDFFLLLLSNLQLAVDGHVPPGLVVIGIEGGG